jgi:hypothetical protein
MWSDAKFDQRVKMNLMCTREKTTKYVGKKRRFYRLKPAPPTENTRNQPNCLSVSHPVSQPSLESSLIWTPIIVEEVSKLQLRPV